MASQASTIKLKPKIYLDDEEHFLVGRMMMKRPKWALDCKVKSWGLCGAVFSRFVPVESLRSIVFSPWVLPPPHISATGEMFISMFAQVETDITANIEDIAEKRGPYIGTIDYVVVLPRKKHCPSRNIHVGEMYRTSKRGTYEIVLHVIPMSVIDHNNNSSNNVTYLIPRSPRARGKRQVKRKVKKAAERKILKG